MLRERLIIFLECLPLLLAVGCSRGVAPMEAGTYAGEQPPGAAKLLARAGCEALEPVFFVTTTACNVPNFLRPARALWRVFTLPVRILDPVDVAFDMAEVPGDLWAPVKGAAAIVCATPKLLGPVRAAGSLALAGAAAFRNVPDAPIVAPKVTALP